MPLRLLLVVFLSLGAASAALSLESDSTGDDQVRLVLGSPQAAIQPGASIPIALVMTPIEGWHLYWSNPGDSGMPPAITTTLPEGAQLSDDWQLPPPGHIIHGGLGTYALKGEVIITNHIELSADYADSSLNIETAVDWLVCDDAMCLAGNAALSLVIPVSTADEAPDVDEVWQTRLDKRAALDPQPISDIAIVSAAAGGDKPSRFGIALPAGLIEEDENALFVPPDNSWVSAGKPQVLRPHAGAHILEIPRNKGSVPNTIQGILVILSDGVPQRSYRISR